jgi:hypothetical protein
MMAAIQEILDYYYNMQPSQEMGSDKLSNHVDIYLYKELVRLGYKGPIAFEKAANAILERFLEVEGAPQTANVRRALLETIALRILDWLRWSRPETFTGAGCDVLPGYYVVKRHGTHFIVAFERLTGPERDAIAVMMSKKAKWAAEKAEAFGKAVVKPPLDCLDLFAFGGWLGKPNGTAHTT